MKCNENIGRLFGTIHRHTRMHYNHEFADLGLGSGGHIFILELNKQDGMTQNEITEKLHFDKAHTARTIVKFIELGYVTKVHDEYDKRAYRLYLTEKGKEIIPTIKHVIKNWADTITEDFSNDEKRTVFELLTRIADKAVNSVKCTSAEKVN